MFVRLTVAFVVVAIVVPVAAALTESAWASIGLDALSGSSPETLSSESKQTRDLDAESAEIHRRIHVKEASIQSLIAGRVTLAEVTSQFLALDENRPAYMAMLRRNQKGATDEEKMARNVISYTLTILNERTLIQRAAVLVRLNSELHHLTSDRTAISRR